MTRNESTEGHAVPGEPELERPLARDRDATEAVLYESFAAIRESDASVAPDLDMLLGRPSPIRSARPRRVWAGLLRLGVPLAAAAALVLLFTRPGADAEFRRAVLAYTTSPALGAWSSPTDFLLNTPGGDMLKRAPDIGRTAPWPALPDVQRVSGDTTHGG